MCGGNPEPTASGEVPLRSINAPALRSIVRSLPRTASLPGGSRLRRPICSANLADAAPGLSNCRDAGRELGLRARLGVAGQPPGWCLRYRRKMKFIGYTCPPATAAGTGPVSLMEGKWFHQSHRPMFCTPPERGGETDDFHFAGGNPQFVIHDPQSTIRNPQSTIHSPQPAASASIRCGNWHL